MKERAASILNMDDENSETINGQQRSGYTTVEQLALETGLRFKMPSQQKKNADLILQEMFEDELEEDDVGPKDIEDLDDLDESEELMKYRPKRKLTFQTIDGD